MREWLERLSVGTLYIEPGSPWENGISTFSTKYFNGKFTDELLSGKIFDTLLEAKVLTEKWIRVYKTIRPHSALVYNLLVSETILPWSS